MGRRLRESWLGWLTLGVILLVGLAPVVRLLLMATVWLDAGDALPPLLDGRTVSLLGRSFGISLVATALAVSAGTIVGLCLARIRFLGRSGLCLFLFIGFCVSPYMLALGWLGGDLTSVWSKSFVGNPWSVAWVLGTAYMPLAALIVFFGARQLSSAPEDAGLLAVGFWRSCVSIVLPRVAGALGVAGLFVFDLTFSDYAVASLLQVPTYPIEVFLNYAGMFHGDQAARSCLPLLAVGSAIALCLAVLDPRIVLRNDSPKSGSDWMVPSTVRSTVFGLAWGTLGVAVIVPIYFLLGRFPSVQVARYALGAGGDAVAHSLLISGMAACWALILALPGSAALLGCGERWARPVIVLLLLPFCVPASAYGIAWVEISARFTPSLATLPNIVKALTPALCLGVRLAGPTVLFLAAARRAIPSEMREAAKLQEGRTIMRSLLIDLPALIPAILGCLGILFALALNAVDILILTVPPGLEVLPLRTDNLIHYGLPEEAIVLAFAAALLATASAALLIWVGRLVRNWSQGC